MRSLAHTLVLLVLTSLAGCSCGDSHQREVDASFTDSGGCGLGPTLFCVSACGSDAGHEAVCVEGGWRCPAGTVDARTCPPQCWGPPPSADCVCDLAATPPSWSCDDACPAGIEPWNPAAPSNACSPEGRMCRSGGDSECGGAMRCECTGGRWNCLVAEPDPACWCGREPTEGGACNEEGMTCGACCPTPGVAAFGPFACVDGHWASQPCPDLVCPTLACPAVRVLGTSCVSDGQVCGDVCCSSQQCIGGVWAPGPDADCLCDTSRTYACGDGSCTTDRACIATCGPTDRIAYVCEPLPAGCTSCECAPWPREFCEERDGHVFVSGGGECP